jgi:hypothetical protein
MYCPTCGNETAVELKYCNRCGTNLMLPSGNIPPQAIRPVRLIGPSVILGLTITVGLGIIFGGVTEFARMGLHPAAITWIVLFSMATLFGCTAMMIRFWSKMLTLQRQSSAPPQNARPLVERGVPQQLPPRFEPVPSVTEHTTRTFAPAYREPSEQGRR